MTTPFTNQAQLSYNNKKVNSNKTEGQIVSKLAASKCAVVPTYTGCGDKVTYLITITNEGCNAYSNVAITDNRGLYAPTDTLELYPLDYIADSVIYCCNGVQQMTAPTVNETATALEFTGVSLPAQSTVSILYETTVNSTAPLNAGATITNCAVISGNGFDDIETQAVISIVQTQELTIAKSMTPENVSDNEELTYTFLIQNMGNAPLLPTDGADFSDTFTPKLTDLSVTFCDHSVGTDVTWVKGTNYTYDESSGAFATMQDQLAVPAATFVQGADGCWEITPGVSEIVICGTIA